MTVADSLISSQAKLKKEINFFTGCGIIIGNIVGSGIFISCGSVLKNTGSPGIALIVWTLSGLISLVGAYCYTELGTLIQTSGGDYAYINKAYGRMMSFLFTYTMVFMTIPIMNAIFAKTVAEYTMKLFFMDCEPDIFTILVQIVAAATLIIVCVVNMSSVKFVSKLQFVFTITKILALITIISAGLYTYSVRSPVKPKEVIKNWFTGHEFSLSKLPMAFYSGFFAYSGWNCLNFLTEEMKEPTKNLPRAIFVSLPFVAMIYLVTNMAYYLVLSPQEIVADNAVVALLFSKKAMSGFPWLISVFISVSTIGALSGCMLGSSRIYYAAARDGNLPQCFALINIKSFTPVTCILLQTVMSLLMLLIKDLDTLILYGTFSEIFFIAITISSLIYFRYSLPDAIRPIKVNICFPITFLLFCVFLLILTVNDKPFESLMSLVFLLSGIPLYAIGVVWKNKPKSFNKFLDNITKSCQILFQSIKED